MIEPMTEPKRDSYFTMAAVGLLVLIILLLGVLWYRERQGRLAAQRSAHVAAAMPMGAPGAAAGPINEILAEMLQKQAGAVQPFGRADLVRTQELVAQGQTRQALVISSASGQRLGFLPGDVVIVEKMPTSAPASAPVSR